jgi:hypothetical protein
VNGWYLDLTGEMPTENFPPRPMKCVAYVNGRVYGIVMSGGSGSIVMQQGPDGITRPDFTYVASNRYFGGVVFSAAASDALDRDLLGSPEESWPLTNLSPSPNAEMPLKIAPAPDGLRLLMINRTGTFLLEEAPDGLHEWRTISLIHGIGKTETFVQTPYGAMWLTQRNQIALLEPGATILQIVSRNYQTLLSGKTAQAAAYVLDPLNEVDRYEVFFTNGTSVIHDFAIGGQGYAATNRDFTAAGTLTDTNGVQSHVVAKRHLYTHEGQPADGQIVTYDRDYTGPSETEDTEITGIYESQWGDGGDNGVTKQMPHVDTIGDPQVQVEWFPDLAGVNDGNLVRTEREKTTQSDTDKKYRHKLSDSDRFWFKLRFRITGRSSEVSKYEPPGEQDDMATALYGAIAEVGLTVSLIGENRP